MKRPTLLAITAALFTMPGLAHACLCTDRNLPEDERIATAAERSKYVVLARITTISPNDHRLGHRADGEATVMERFKSDGSSPGTIQIKFSERGGFSSSCTEGVALKQDDYVLLYLDSLTVTEMNFDECARSKSAPSIVELEHEIEMLRSIRDNRSQPSHRSDPPGGSA